MIRLSENIPCCFAYRSFARGISVFCRDAACHVSIDELAFSLLLFCRDAACHVSIDELAFSLLCVETRFRVLAS